MTSYPSLLDDAQFDAYLLRGREDALVRHYETEAVAWSPDAPAPAYLDPVAALVWDLLDDDYTVAEVIDDVHEVLGIPGSIARNQMRRVVALLEGSALLESASPHTVWPDAVHFQLPPNP